MNEISDILERGFRLKTLTYEFAIKVIQLLINNNLLINNVFKKTKIVYFNLVCLFIKKIK